MTTADYLESLQNDLNNIVTTLELEEGSNFSDISTMVTGGEITKGGGGGNLTDYLNNEISYGTSNIPGWKNTIKKPLDTLIIANADCSYMFTDYPNTTIPILTDPNVTITNMNYMFANSQATEIDLSNLDLSSVTNVAYAFNNCRSLTKLDIRTLETGSITSKNRMIYNVPTSCLIIVKDATVRQWLQNNFIVGNVKTVEEYEESL